MPYYETKLPSGKVKVTGPSGVHAKGTTKKKADAQIRIMNMQEHGVTPKGGWRKQRGTPLSSFAPNKKKKGR